jgi:hypothetical protein
MAAIFSKVTVDENAAVHEIGVLLRQTYMSAVSLGSTAQSVVSECMVVS